MLLRVCELPIVMRKLGSRLRTQRTGRRVEAAKGAGWLRGCHDRLHGYRATIIDLPFI